MGHKRHKIKGDFSNVNPGRGGPGITEDGYPPHLVVVSVEHPEINPKGVTVETFTEEVTEEKTFGTNVGEAIEDFINETNQTNNNPNKKDTTMNEEQNNTKETTNNETNQNNNPNEKENNMNNEQNTKETTNNNQENVNMNNANINPNGTIDDGSNNTVNQKPSLAKEAASAFVVGAAYGAGTITAILGVSLLVAGIRKLACGDATTADDAAATVDTTETVETVAEAFLR